MKLPSHPCRLPAIASAFVRRRNLSFAVSPPKQQTACPALERPLAFEALRSSCSWAPHFLGVLHFFVDVRAALRQLLRRSKIRDWWTTNATGTRTERRTTSSNSRDWHATPSMAALITLIEPIRNSVEIASKFVDRIVSQIWPDVGPCGGELGRSIRSGVMIDLCWNDDSPSEGSLNCPIGVAKQVPLRLPSWPKFGRSPASFGRVGARFGRCWASFGRSSSPLGQHRLKSGQCW